jgi:RNA polymerase sigma factor (TIGR02999 family)
LDTQQATRLLTQAFYEDLKRVAHRERLRLGGGRRGTLQTTALIHEAYLKLSKGGAWESREHFMNAAAVAMRQAIVDYARGGLREKRGSGRAALTLSHALDVAEESRTPLLEVDAALEKLEALDPRLVRIVECRYFAGYSVPETAATLGIAERTVHRDWLRAKAWLYRELNPEG